MIVEPANSIATLGGMETKPNKLLPWQVEDAKRLKALFENRKDRLSQEQFGATYEIGSQGMVWQYLNGHRPLNIKAAEAFARGLGVKIEAFSPTLSEQITRAAGSASETAKQGDSKSLRGLEAQLATILRLLSSSGEDGKPTADQIIELLTLFEQSSLTGRVYLLKSARVAAQRNDANWQSVVDGNG